MNKFNLSLALLFFALLNFTTLNAQDSDCDLNPPAEVTFLEIGGDYFNATWQATGASNYRVFVIDLSDYTIHYDEVVSTEEVLVTGIPITENTYLGIESICDNGEASDPGLIPLQEIITPIGVSDVVMQMDSGPVDPTNQQRTLECFDPIDTLTLSSYNFMLNFDQNLKSIIVDITYTPGGPTTNGKMIFNRNGRIDRASLNNLEQSGDSIKLNTGVLFLTHDYTSAQPGNGIYPYFTLTIDPAINIASAIISEQKCEIPFVMTQPTSSLISQSFNEVAQVHNRNKVASDQPQPLQLAVYPNPAQSYLQVLQSSAGMLTVRSINGQVMYQQQNSDNQMTLDIQDWPSGLYMIEIVENGQRKAKRFLKL